MSKRTWTDNDLRRAVKNSLSYRQTLIKLGLVPKGGSYKIVKNHIERLLLDTSHFRGQAWNKGLKTGFNPRLNLEEILVKNSTYQSYKLKARLFRAKLKKPKCEECGWAKISEDGRLPLELDHINGNSRDNRFENLRILCPNCHALKATHRGSKLKKK